MKKLVTEVSGVVEAPAAQVRAALARVLLPGTEDVHGRFAVEDIPGHTSTAEQTRRSFTGTLTRLGAELGVRTQVR